MYQKKIDFTVLIPVFNTLPQPLMEAVGSILNQQYNGEFEILIVDDGSTDALTLSVLEKLNKIKNITVVYCPVNLGTSNVLNIGHDLIKTEWIALMGSDDISLPHRFRKQLRHLEDNPDIDVLGTNLYTFYHEDTKRPSVWTSKKPYMETLEDQSYGWLTNHGTVFYKNQAVKDIGGYNLACRRGQDVDLWKRMFLAGKKIRTLPDVLYAWRRFKQK
jgi:glycosyltransferase involved in cell wall biosynthesis